MSSYINVVSNQRVLLSNYIKRRQKNPLYRLISLCYAYDYLSKKSLYETDKQRQYHMYHVNNQIYREYIIEDLSNIPVKIRNPPHHYINHSS